jgi:hypothetical protein
MEKDRQESTRKKRKAPLWLVDPRRDAKVSCPSVKRPTAPAAMPPPAVPAAVAKRAPSPSRASEVEGVKGAKTGEVGRELSMDDYLIEDVSMFDAQTGLLPGGECIYCCVSFFYGMCSSIDLFLAAWSRSGQMVVMPVKPTEERAQAKAAMATSLDSWAQFCVGANCNTPGVTTHLTASMDLSMG